MGEKLLLRGRYKNQMRTLKIVVSLIFILVAIAFVICIINGWLFNEIYNMKINTIILAIIIILNVINIIID